MTSASPTAALDVACPTHPTFKPVGTCSRCGRFVCARCETWGDVCASCEYRRLRELPSLRSRGSLARFFLCLVALQLLFGAGIAGWLIAQLEAGMAASKAVDIWQQGSRGLDLSVIPVTTLSALFFLRWLYLAVRTAKLLGLEPGTTPGWAMAWWFIPLANLYDPYLVMRGLWLSLGGARMTAAVTAWWTACVLGAIAWIIQEYLFWTLGSEPLLVTSTLLSGFTARIILTVGALLCMAVIGKIESLTDECLEEVAEAA